jgi:hypothetical protein
MSLFARILSHGFALVVVVLLGLGLVYRGDLFPGMEMPEFLAFERAADSGTNEVTGSVTRGETVSANDGQVPGPADQQSIADEAGSVQDSLSATTGNMTVPSIAAPGDGASASPVEDTTPAPAMPADDVSTSDEGAEAGSVQDSLLPTMNNLAVPSTAAPGDGAPASPVEDATRVPAMPADDASVSDEGAEAGMHEAPVEAPAADTLTVTDTPAAPVAAPAAIKSTVTDAQTRTAPSSHVAAPVVPSGEGDLAAPAVVGSSATNQQPAKNAMATGKPAESPYRLLAAAREAYWLRDYATAEEKYQAMIDLDPTNPDGFGELGNMYFSQGKWELASATYFEAGKRLADEGLLEQARQLVDVLKGLQGPQAKALEKYIADKSTTTQ